MVSKMKERMKVIAKAARILAKGFIEWILLWILLLLRPLVMIFPHLTEPLISRVCDWIEAWLEEEL